MYEPTGIKVGMVHALVLAGASSTVAFDFSIVDFFLSFFLFAVLISVFNFCGEWPRVKG